MPRTIPQYNFVANNCVPFDTDSEAAKAERRAHPQLITKTSGSRAHQRPKDPLGTRIPTYKGCGKRMLQSLKNIPTLSIKDADKKMQEMLLALA